jgi:hypothetical protein
MRCRYKYCKNNNEVKKEDAIKEGNSYYCEECYQEKQNKQKIEEFYIRNMPQTTLQLLRKVIKQLIHEKKYKSEYVLFVLEYINKNNKPINNPFGLLNYCNEGSILNLYNKQLINKQYKEIKSDITNYSENKVEFTYKPNNKKWTDLL